MKKANSRGFTLIELMVVIGIILILATLTMLAMANAQESARIAATKSLISRLNAFVMQKYESYRYRRLPIQMPIGVPPQTAAQIKCDAVRQLMRMEMPDRWSDIADGPATPTYTYTPVNGGSPVTVTISMPRPAVSQAYLSTYNSIGSPPALYQGAKCLYLLVTMGLEENDVMENFNTNEYKDLDNSGSKCFVDAWGNPIRFLRWAPGFMTNPYIPSGAGITAPLSGVSRLQTGWDRDQTDPMGIYGNPPTQPASGTTTATAMIDNPAVEAATNTYALYPLIYSAGPDGLFDIVSDSAVAKAIPAGYTPPAGSAGNASAISGLHYSGCNNNPFYSVNDATNFAQGSIGTPNTVDTPRSQPGLSHFDNVHNHLLNSR